MKIRRTSWNALPTPLEKAGRLAFPECKSPRSIPLEKWIQLVAAYRTWMHIFYSDGLALALFRREIVSVEKGQGFLNDVAQEIARGKYD